MLTSIYVPTKARKAMFVIMCNQESVTVMDTLNANEQALTSEVGNDISGPQKLV